MGARLGQHYLRSPWAARALVSAGNISSDDTVLEIGPGKGVLTRELLKTGAHIIAIEKDEGLVSKLEETFTTFTKAGQLEILCMDVRNFEPSRTNIKATRYSVAANIPYYITGEIIRKFLTARFQPHTMALLVQKEVARRIATDKKESILSLSVKAYGEPRLVRTVGKREFTPPPSVDSAILVINNISRAFFSDKSSSYGDTMGSEKLFFELVRAGFASKRKLLLGNLSRVFGKGATESAFSACDVPEKARAEDVPLAKWKCLTDSIRAS